MKYPSVLLFFCAFLLIFNFSCKDDDGPQVELPQTIKNYLESNYPDAEIEESEMGTLCIGTEVYEVELEINDDDEIDLAFNAEGAFLFMETEISNENLPAAVTTSISSNYSNYSVDEAERLDLADGSTQYEVDLKNGSTQLEVLFQEDGTVICEQEDDDD